MATNVSELEALEPLPEPIVGSSSAVLALSDLHLGEGLDPDTGRYCRRENFLADSAFRELLQARDPRTTLLVLNGDTFDFLRVIAKPDESKGDFKRWERTLKELHAPRSPEELHTFGGREETYGLRTNDYKSVWKLMVIQSGHKEFFEALEQWVSRGGAIVFVKGNHDLELHWPLVQEAIRSLIGATTPDTKARVIFRERGFCIKNLYFEHGHRFERSTTVHGDVLLENHQELRLPVGSFVNRYVVNRLDGIELFFSNTKPLDALLWKLMRRHPLKMSWVIGRGTRYLIRALRRYWHRDSLAFAVFFGSLLLPVIAIVAIIAAYVLSGYDLWIRDHLGWGRYVLSVLGLAAPFLVGLVRDLLAKRKRTVGDDEFTERAYEALSDGLPTGRYQRCYAVLGHTHRADVQALHPPGRPSVWYVNTGTWAPRWEEDRPDLLGRIVHSVVEFNLRGPEYRHSCSDWKPQDAGSVPAVLFEASCTT